VHLCDSPLWRRTASSFQNRVHISPHHDSDTDPTKTHNTLLNKIKLSPQNIIAYSDGSYKWQHGFSRTGAHQEMCNVLFLPYDSFFSPYEKNKEGKRHSIFSFFRLLEKGRKRHQGELFLTLFHFGSFITLHLPSESLNF
jgi:hypothetical protein